MSPCRRPSSTRLRRPGLQNSRLRMASRCSPAIDLGKPAGRGVLVVRPDLATSVAWIHTRLRHGRILIYGPWEAFADVSDRDAKSKCCGAGDTHAKRSGAR